MKDGFTVMGLDVATAYGFAMGKPGEGPLLGHGQFRVAEAVDEAVYFSAFKWANEFFTVHRPSALFVEEPILIVNRGPNRRPENGKTLQRLWTLSGVVRMVAHARSIHRIHTVTADAVRRHFIGMKKALNGDVAKRLVQERCTELGLPWKTADEADAIALWSLGCEAIQPGSGYAYERRLIPVLPKQIKPQERMTAKEAHALLFQKGKLK